MLKLEMLKILREHYSLGELEERLGLTTEDLEDGLMALIEEREHDIDQMLREDLWL